MTTDKLDPSTLPDECQPALALMVRHAYDVITQYPTDATDDQLNRPESLALLGSLRAASTAYLRAVGYSKRQFEIAAGVAP